MEDDLDQRGGLHELQAQLNELQEYDRQAASFKDLKQIDLSRKNLSGRLIGATGGQRAAMLRWQAIKQAAIDELQSGHRAAEVIEGPFGKPFARAQFLALRHSLRAEWNPSNGIEQSFIDTMAQAQTLSEIWTKQLMKVLYAA